MDFFATGGFQQLFSDLDEQHEELQYQDFSLEPQHDSGFYMLDSYEDSNSLNGSSSSYNDNNKKNNNKNNNNNNNTSHLLTADYELLTSCSDKITRSHLLDLNDSTAKDYNNNHESNNPMSDSQLEHCLDYLLPLDADTFDVDTPTRLIQEVAEWEAQFLDNYIEIPELVDFLPEKTPLCTDTCELFLHESSKNLRLFRNKHKTKSDPFPSNELKAGCGYPCNFGSCQKIYAKPAHLKAHLRRHLGEKPYICTWPECTWKFSRSDELARHRRSHSGVKPYKCDYCTKCFARSDHLAKHRKVHERRLLAAKKAGCGANGPDGALPSSVLNVRPGRKRKNQPC